MKNYLILTDFSENSFTAIRYALVLFKDVQLKFLLLHIGISESRENKNDLNPRSSEWTKDHAKRRFNTLLSGIKEYSIPDKHTFIPVILCSPPVESIRNIVADHEVDLIIMAARGNSKTDLPLGWFTKEVVTKVKCSILLIPERVNFRLPKNLAFLTDYDFFFKNVIIETLLEIVGSFNLNLKILRVSQSQPISDFQHINREYLLKRFKSTQETYHILENSGLSEKLQKFLDEKQIDMVAVIAKNLNFLKQTLYTAVTEKSNYTRYLPFLILHE